MTKLYLLMPCLYDACLDLFYILESLDQVQYDNDDHSDNDGGFDDDDDNRLIQELFIIQ